MLSDTSRQSVEDDEAGLFRPRPTPRRWPAALVLGITSAALFVVGFAPAFNHFEPYNDEGLYLVQLNEAVARAGPYTHLYTAYGPAYNLFITAVTMVTRIPLDHDGNRLITLVLWVAAAAAAGVFVWRQTRSLPLMVMTAIAGFLWIEVLTDEPGQPATFGFLLTFVLLWVVQRSEPWRGRNAAIIGGLCAALLLVKINLGLYAIAAVAITIVTTAECRHWFRLLVFAASVAMPVVILKHGLVHHGIDELLFLFIVELGVASLILRSRFSERHLAIRWLTLAAGGAVVLVLVLLGAVVQGDSIGAVIRAVFLHSLNYLSNDAIFNVSMAGPWLAMLLAFAGMAIVLSTRWTWLRIVLRAAVLLTVFLPLLYPNSLNGLLSPLMAWAVVPILLIGDGQPRTAQSPARLCLAAMIVFNELQTYPIAGSHLSFSSFLAVPAAFVVMEDLVVDVKALGGADRTTRVLRILTLGVPMVLTAVIVVQATTKQWSIYSKNVPLRLSGSHLMRLPPHQVAALEATVHNVQSRSCKRLVTYPGMLSFYLWTGLPAPPGLVVADSINWQRPQNRSTTMKYLLQAHDTCLVSNPLIQVFWEDLDATPSWPELTHVLATHFVRRTATGGSYFVSQSAP